jgi:hypothetical protein
VKAWKLPLVVIAIVAPIALAFYLGGPGVGVAIGALAGVGIVVAAARQRPRGKIGEDSGESGRRRLLLVVSRPVEEAAAIREIVAQVERDDSGDGGATEVLALAPARLGFLDRWASDLEGARREAQSNLVITVASLAKAGVEAEARVGDEDIVQAVEDQLGSFAATEVILAMADEGEDPAAARAAIELERRLRARFRRLVLSDPGAR